MYRYVGYKGFYLFGKIFIGGEKAGTYKTVKQAFIGSTTSSPKFAATLEELRNTTFMQIISGEKPASEFDNFVTQWNSLGGQTFTQEVNDQLKK
jgi:putative aldouronate transport system substrate-binding protein